MENDQQTFWGHVDELRSTLLRCLGIIVAGVACSFFFYPQIFKVIEKPLKQFDTLEYRTLQRKRITNTGKSDIAYSLPNHSSIVHLSESLSLPDNKYLIPPGRFLDIETSELSERLWIFGPLEGIMTACKVCFWVGLIGTSPIWIWLVMQFVAPALRSEELRLVFPFLVASLLCLIAGFFCAYYFTIPLSNQYLIDFNSDIGSNLWSLSQYVDYTLFILLANGLAFELGCILFLLVHFRILNVDKMVRIRRYMIVAAFVLGAILTPPDIVSQLLLAIPLIILYEIAIVYARFQRISTANVEDKESVEHFQ